MNRVVATLGKLYKIKRALQISAESFGWFPEGQPEYAEIKAELAKWNGPIKA
jgi:hypothetical protein